MPTVILDRPTWLDRPKDLDRGIRHMVLERSEPCPHDTVHQVHGVDIVEASAETSKAQGKPNADGIYSQSGKSIAVASADCLPVILWSSTNSMNMALHAGWRGLLGGIIAEGLKIFATYNIPPESVRAYLGPCISPGRFEVGPEVLESFVNTGRFDSFETASVWRKGARDRWYLDLQTTAIFDLVRGGVPAEQITVLRQCTYDTPEWPSYRREGKYEKRIVTCVGE